MKGLGGYREDVNKGDGAVVRKRFRGLGKEMAESR